MPLAPLCHLGLHQASSSVLWFSWFSCPKTPLRNPHGSGPPPLQDSTQKAHTFPAPDHPPTPCLCCPSPSAHSIKRRQPLTADPWAFNCKWQEVALNKYLLNYLMDDCRKSSQSRITHGKVDSCDTQNLSCQMSSLSLWRGWFIILWGAISGGEKSKFPVSQVVLLYLP